MEDDRHLQGSQLSCSEMLVQDNLNWGQLMETVASAQRVGMIWIRDKKTPTKCVSTTEQNHKRTRIWGCKKITRDPPFSFFLRELLFHNVESCDCVPIKPCKKRKIPQ